MTLTFCLPKVDPYFCCIQKVIILDHSARPTWHEQVLASFQRELAKCKARSCELCWGPKNQRHDKWWYMISKINLYGAYTLYTYQASWRVLSFGCTRSSQIPWNPCEGVLIFWHGSFLPLFQCVGCVTCFSNILTFLDFVACLHKSVNHNFNHCAPAAHLHSHFFNHWQIPDCYGQSLNTKWSNSMYILDSLQVFRRKEPCSDPGSMCRKNRRIDQNNTL